LWLIANPNNSQFWANCRSPLLFAYYSPFAIRRSLPFSVVADSLMADTRVCPYHSLFAIRYSLPFDQSPIANRQSLPFRYSLPLRDCDKFWGGGA
jgi:hypothetical protein